MMDDKVQVHELVLMVVDHDGIGVDEVVGILEGARYPNHCMSPTVMRRETREVEWSDDHPLNTENAQREFARLFGRPTERAAVTDGLVVRFVDNGLYYPEDTADQLPLSAGVGLADAHVWEAEEYDPDGITLYPGEEVVRVRIHTIRRIEEVTE